MMTAKFIASVTRPEDLPKQNLPHIALVGRSNAGKSSLVNHLTNQKGLARVSAAPGRTQTINLYEIDRRYFLVDLPGYGFAKGPKEKRDNLGDIINTYLESTPKLQYVFLVVSAVLGLTELDKDMLEFLSQSGTPFAIIVNKADKLKPNELAKLLQKLSADHPGIECIPHANTTAKYRGRILETIECAMRAAAKND